MSLIFIELDRSRTAPIGNPPSKKKASSFPSRSASAASWDERRWTCMSAGVMAYPSSTRVAFTSVPEPAGPSDTRLPSPGARARRAQGTGPCLEVRYGGDRRAVLRHEMEVVRVHDGQRFRV